jgi:hypothetical protein
VVWRSLVGFASLRQGSTAMSRYDTARRASVCLVEDARAEPCKGGTAVLPSSLPFLSSDAAQ